VAEVLAELVHLPVGSHCISFHASQEEATDHAVDFLAGSPPGQAASYWVSDSAQQVACQEKLAVRAPSQVGCVRVLEEEQVRPTNGHLRPIDEVLRFVGSHPEGVTGGADTLSQRLTPGNVPDHLEYEAWFDRQPRDGSRFLCPYDLRRIPPDDAPATLRELGAHHSHAVLSSSPEPAVRLLQLFIFATPAELPPELDPTFGWAVRSGLIEVHGPTEEFTLSESGNQVVRDWSHVARIDW
jgi:hypothetical protein